MITPDVQAAAAHAVGDRMSGSAANICQRHHGRPGGTVTAVDGTKWTRVAYSGGSYCEGPAVAFTAAEPDAGPPSLPAGWLTRADSDGTYYHKTIEQTAAVDVARDGVYVTVFGVRSTTPDRFLALGSAITEAAAILVQLRAGAAPAAVTA